MPISQEAKEATNHLLSHAQQMRAVITIAEELDRVGGLEAFAAEAEGRKKTADAELEKADGRLDEAKAKLDAIGVEAAAARDKARSIIDDARTEAESIKAKARTEGEAKAAKIVEAGEANLTKAHAAELVSLDRLAGINAEIATATDHLKSIRAETAGVQAKADEARAYLAKLAGG